MTTNSASGLLHRRVLVTGGSRGIGAAIVRRLAHDGAAVAFTYTTDTPEVDELVTDHRDRGMTVVPIRADSGDPDAVAAAVRTAVDSLGGLDVLVNNAAVTHIAPVDSYPRDQFDRLVAVNVAGPFWYVQNAVPHLGAGSRIINVGSINADRVQQDGLSAYAMTKGAIAALTRALARELGPRGITVNNVQPGPVATEMNPEIGAHADKARSFIALGEYGQPADVAAVVSFLCSSESKYVTGANWNVDGGFTA
ncbi:SDR family oxidoreductase [Acrocarpospora macrocephala]|uniref:3-ketoacyl-ACP reductase n=1 Tax=Acrocarpospora macrocephala TaxID=150177 RepID=A0A5M3WQS5_9ACTN|nr:SDR family oxidoreductase [Acrocarpospora macrocephala]GES09641.1 3-ketoacyl-ACP reductase [Acrocarpospora macrocephala]